MTSGIRAIVISQAGYERADVHSQKMAKGDEKEIFITLWP
jgi:hypothetical protein